MPEPLIQNVADTAFWVATYRAQESLRPDALFRDPLAERLAGAHGKAIAASMSVAQMTGWSVVMRTVVIDEFVRQAIADGFDAVVNLGAGLDTRPYRMDLPASLHWVEVDQPQVIAYKDAELKGEAPRCKLERVSLDLSRRPERQALFARLQAAHQKVLVLTEGVVVYLSEQQAGELADDLRACDHFERWVVEYFSAKAMAYRARSGMAQHLRQAPLQFAPSDWLGFFAQHGWTVREIRDLVAVSERLHRSLPLPPTLRMLGKLAFRFARSRQGTVMGYLLLGPTG